MPMTPPAAVIVLAAGAGTRMKSQTPKVLHQVCGRSLVGHVVTTAQTVGAQRVVVVLGHAREQVAEHLAQQYPDVVTTVQEQQNGTGHAVRTALAQLEQQGIVLGSGAVVVVSGDSPFADAGDADSVDRRTRLGASGGDGPQRGLPTRPDTAGSCVTQPVW